MKKGKLLALVLVSTMAIMPSVMAKNCNYMGGYNNFPPPPPPPPPHMNNCNHHNCQMYYGAHGGRPPMHYRGNSFINFNYSNVPYRNNHSHFGIFLSI